MNNNSKAKTLFQGTLENYNSDRQNELLEQLL